MSPQYLNSVKIGNINAPLRHIHCAILTKFSGFVGSSVVDPGFTFCQMYLRFLSYGGRWNHHGMLELKNSQIWGVLPLQDNRVNWSWWNLAISHAKSDPDRWSIMGTGAPKIQNLSNFRFFCLAGLMVYTNQGKIWPGRIHYGSSLSCQIWPWSVKGLVQEPPV